jgi:hypothetical protein
LNDFKQFYTQYDQRRGKDFGLAFPELKNGMTQYKYNSTDLVRPTELSERERFLLEDSKHFVSIPGSIYTLIPQVKHILVVMLKWARRASGQLQNNTLEEIWHNDAMKKLRADMLSETPNATCGRCYEQEESGFFSGRKSANKHHGHHVKKLETNPFEMTYWDIRFQILCNLKCRMWAHL